jgi:diguanylate cyclase (GGDEF)-like protein
VTRGWASADAQLLCAGATLCLSICLAAIYQRSRRDPLLREVSFFAGTLTAVLLATVAMFRFRSNDVPLLARTLALYAAVVVCVRLASTMRGRPAPGWLRAGVGVLVVGRLALWPTDLVFAHRFDAHGLPVYGPWMSATGMALVLLPTAYLVYAALQVDDRLETIAYIAAMSASCAMLTSSVFVTDSLVSEPLASYWTLPQLVALTIITLRRLSRVTRRERLLAWHQEVLAQLSRHAFEITDFDEVLRLMRANVEAVLPALRCTFEVVAEHEAREPSDTAVVVPIDGFPLLCRAVTERPVQLSSEDETFLGTLVGLVAAWVRRREVEAQVRHAALHDPLTGLPNRAMLTSWIECALADPQRSSHAVGVIIADLDGFQRVNDSFGSVAGDELLREIGRRLVSTLPAAEVSRAGGDVFAMALAGVSAEVVSSAAADTLSVLAGDYACEGNTFGFTASVGVALATGEDTASSLLRNAESAMHRAKRSGGHRVEVFEQRLRRQLLDRLRLEHELSRAVDDGNIVLHYQPVVDVEDGSVIGVEALSRWRRAGELAPPGEWIPVAEETGLITGIGAHVMMAACGEAIGVGSPLPASAYVAVNVSARQVDDELLPMVERVLAGGTDPRRLIVEITETAVMEQPDLARRLLTELRERGVRIALDDFGTGHSSLSMLTRLPVDVIKIDRSFISRIVERDGAALVTSIVSLAGSLQLSVIAEGVETVEQLELVRDLGCRYAQGFLFARPATLKHLRSSYSVPGRSGNAGVVLPMQRSPLRKVSGLS